MTTPADTLESNELVLPSQANHHGTLFAGHGLQLLAKAAFLTARAHAGGEVVMAAATRVDFLVPVPVGHALALRSRVSRVGRSSLTVCVDGVASAPGHPEQLALKGVFDMVAVDGQGTPRPIATARRTNPLMQETA